MRSFSIPNDIWDRTSTIWTFLQSPESRMEFHYGLLFATFTVTVKACNAILGKCKTMIDNNGTILSCIAKKMADALQVYNGAFYDEIGRLVNVLEPRLWSDLLLLLRASPPLRFPWFKEFSSHCEESTTNSDVNMESGRNHLQNILCVDTLHDCYQEEIVSYSYDTATGYKRLDPFQWWRANERRYPNIAQVSPDVLASSASHVCSEECFRWPVTWSTVTVNGFPVTLFNFKGCCGCGLGFVAQSYRRSPKSHLSSCF